MFCEKCGNELEENVSICPKCGCPTNYNVTQTKVNSSSNNNKKEENQIFAVLSFSLLGLSAIFYIFFVTFFFQDIISANIFLIFALVLNIISMILGFIGMSIAKTRKSGNLSSISAIIAIFLPIVVTLIWMIIMFFI